ncbi:MAG: AraC family transcriptional regulator [Nocardioidaceae bacterium]
MPDSLTVHDRVPDPPDPEPTPPLATMLSQLHLRGAIFLRGDYSEAWAYESLPSSDAAAILAPEAERVLLFHVVATGRCWIETEPGKPHWASAGDVIVLPYNAEHRMGGTDAAECVAVADLIDPPPWDRMPVIEYGGGGDRTTVVCGYLACDDPLFDPRMRVFPQVFVVSPPEGTAREWVRASVALAMQQTTQVAADRFIVPTRVPEVLLVEILTLHMASVPAADRGWVHAIRDPVIAPALAAIHASPEHRWTVTSLAKEAGVSDSLLDSRFRAVLGLAPIRYLAGWRMHVAGDLLVSTTLGVGAVARRVGFDSEEAFSRAFKRTHGKPPSRWRGAAS